MEFVEESETDKIHYPIETKMFNDLRYHVSRHSEIVLHLCPFQIRESTHLKAPFIQYFLRKTKTDEMDITGDRIFPPDCLSFWRQEIEHPILYNLPSELMILVKIMLAHYGVHGVNDADLKYVGFHKSDNHFFVFYDLSSIWVNHHFLNIDDGFWLSTVSEIVKLREVCMFPVSDIVVDLFHNNSELQYLVKNDNALNNPIVGYSIEDAEDMDFQMTFGTEKTTEKACNIGECFRYFISYRDCLKKIESGANRNGKVIMRSVLNFSDLIPLCQEEFMDIFDEDTMYLVNTDSPDDAFIVIRNHSNQTPVCCHNVID